MSLIQKNKLLSEISTFKVGGPAKYYAKVTSQQEFQSLIPFLQQEKMPFLVVGKGSNLLFDDRGFDGLIIHNTINWLNRDNHLLSVSSGYSFALLGTQIARKGYSGLEFASGIPGSVGGAVFMNAGASGKETADSLTSVTFLHLFGEMQVYKKEEIEFSYRFSSFQKMEGFILSAEFHLQKDPEARKRQIELALQRKKTQPLWEHSAGCIFRNPPVNSAGKLIEEAGLKGFQIGGAKVSDLHANFIVNVEKATAKDILSLIDYVKNGVREKKKVSLVPEVRYIPFS